MSLQDNSFKLLDFTIYDEKYEPDPISSSSDDDSSDNSRSGGYKINKDCKRFIIQMFGINEHGETFCVFVNDYKPFFYIKVDDSWTIETKGVFLTHIKSKLGKYYEDSITECKIIKRKTLYGFDAGKEHKFVLLKFQNTPTMNKVKNLFYRNGKN